MVQQLGALPTLPKYPDSNFSTYIQAIIQIKFNNLFCPPWVPHTGKTSIDMRLKLTKFTWKEYFRELIWPKNPQRQRNKSKI